MVAIYLKNWFHRRKPGRTSSCVQKSDPDHPSIESRTSVVESSSTSNSAEVSQTYVHNELVLADRHFR
jgi:hypothetical protein